MNNFRWMTTLLNATNLGSKMGFTKKRRNNRGTMLMSLLGVAATAAFYGMRKNKNNMQMPKAFQNVASNIQNTFKSPNLRPAMAEFANELTPEDKAKISPQLSEFARAIQDSNENSSLSNSENTNMNVNQQTNSNQNNNQQTNSYQNNNVESNINNKQ